MEKEKYRVLIDSKEVAGMKNPGLGETLELTAEQAEHPLRLGHIDPHNGIPLAKAKVEAAKAQED